MFPHFKSAHCLKVKMTAFLGLSYIKYKIIIFINNVKAKKLISRSRDVFCRAALLYLRKEWSALKFFYS